MKLSCYPDTDSLYDGKRASGRFDHRHPNSGRGAITPTERFGLARIAITVLVCSVIAGTLGGLFSVLLLWGEQHLSGASASTILRESRLPAVCRLVALGLLSHGLTYGTRCEQAKSALDSKPVSGWRHVPGTVFAPSLGAVYQTLTQELSTQARRRPPSQHLPAPKGRRADRSP
jgi:hypothetical protein